MAPPFAAVFLIFLSIFTTFSTSFSSTIGVGYISRLLDIQDRERAPSSVQVAAARGVLRRLLPSHLSSFDFQILSKVLGILGDFNLFCSRTAREYSFIRFSEILEM